jgi:enoyl-CoA hydratase/carnithine racemase
MTKNLSGSVDLEIIGQVAHLILNRPEKINAMTVKMDEQLNSYLHELNNNLEIRCALLSGKGEKGFCAGSDLTDLGDYGSNWQYRNRFDRNLDYARAIWLIKKPVVAALHGWVVGGGLEMACASDIRIGSPDTKFQAGEIRWGWHGGSGQTQLLTHTVGPGNANLLLLHGEKIEAEAALRMGLIQEIVPRESVMNRAFEIANSIADKAPIAAQMTKHMVRIAQSTPLEVGLLYENDSFSYCMTTEDAAEGQRAFAQKRKPNFKGR